MPDVTDATADVSGEADRAELRALLRSAVRGLNASDQDLIELQMRQGLDVAEIAAMLGVSRNHAHALLSRTRDQLETSLGALLVARTGREDCAPLSAMLEGWDGQLTVLMRKRLHRHIERCPVCAERKRRELAPALLLGLAPLAALSSAAMPAGLRAHVLKLASSDTPEAVAHRAIVAQHTALFGHTGFPKPLDPPKPPPWWRTRQGQVTAGGRAAAAAVLIILAATGVLGGAPQPAERAEPGLVRSGARLRRTASGAPARTGAPGGSGSHGQLRAAPAAPAATASAAAHVSPSPSAGGTAPAGGPSPGGLVPGAGAWPSARRTPRRRATARRPVTARPPARPRRPRAAQAPPPRRDAQRGPQDDRAQPADRRRP